MIGYLCDSVTSGPKESRELMMACDEASEESEFLSALLKCFSCAFCSQNS